MSGFNIRTAAFFYIYNYCLKWKSWLMTWFRFFLCAKNGWCKQIFSNIIVIYSMHSLLFLEIFCVYLHIFEFVLSLYKYVVFWHCKKKSQNIKNLDLKGWKNLTQLGSIKNWKYKYKYILCRV